MLISISQKYVDNYINNYYQSDSLLSYTLDGYDKDKWIKSKSFNLEDLRMILSMYYRKLKSLGG